MKYETRNNMLSPASTWTLEPAGIRWENNAVNQLIPWSEVREIRLQYAPTRYVANRYTCELQLKSGGKIWFSSHKYTGFAQFQDTTETYSAFVRELVNRLGSHNPHCYMRSGSGTLAYVANLLTVLFSGFLLFVAGKLIFLMGLTWLVAVKLVVICYYIPRVFRWLKVNRGRAFHPDSIPPGALPFWKDKAAAIAQS